MGFPAGYRDSERMNQANRELIKQGKEPVKNPVDPILEIQNVDEYANVKAYLEILYQYDGQFSLPEQVDAVVSVDAYHLLHSPAYGTDKVVLGIDKTIFASLKPGGTLLVIDYAASRGAGFGQAAALQRVEVDAVKTELQSAGFVFDGDSSVLTNATDNKTAAVTPATRDSADQFVLRFKKPANMPGDKRALGMAAVKTLFGNTLKIGRAHV